MGTSKQGPSLLSVRLRHSVKFQPCSGRAFRLSTQHLLSCLRPSRRTHVSETVLLENTCKSHASRCVGGTVLISRTPVVHDNDMEVLASLLLQGFRVRKLTELQSKDVVTRRVCHEGRVLALRIQGLGLTSSCQITGTSLTLTTIKLGYCTII